MEFLRRILFSKKMIALIVGLLAEFLAAKFGIVLGPELQITLMQAIAGLTGAFMVGQGVADAGSKGRTSAGRDIYD